MNPALLETDLPGVERYGRGKVRDVYSVDDRLLIVATDRISAFDYILPTGIPDKGKVLTQLSIFWFDFLRELTPTHFHKTKNTHHPARETIRHVGGNVFATPVEVRYTPTCGCAAGAPPVNRRARQLAE